MVRIARLNKIERQAEKVRQQARKRYLDFWKRYTDSELDLIASGDKDMLEKVMSGILVVFGSESEYNQAVALALTPEEKKELHQAEKGITHKAPEIDSESGSFHPQL